MNLNCVMGYKETAAFKRQKKSKGHKQMEGLLMVSVDIMRQEAKCIAEGPFPTARLACSLL